MSLRSQAWTVENAAWATAQPRLSVLIPFLRDDPRLLLGALDEEARHLAGVVEIVVLDDGSGDSALAEGVTAAALAMSTPTSFIRLSSNEGRARGRNRLTASARGQHFLFLDSDMRPDRPTFLAEYLALITAEDPAVTFGGFTLDHGDTRPEFALHRAVTLRAECRPAEERAAEAAKTVCASNLLVRRDVFDVEPFDERFVGWGWEEVEWAVRVSARWPVRHVDNTATHLGLDTPAALLAKYEQSRGNFARMLERHGDIVRAFPSYRVARLLRSMPLRATWRGVLKRLALAEHAPMLARVFAAKLFRAAVYAEVV